MNSRKFKFSSATVDYYFTGQFSWLKKIVDQKNAVIITDENIWGIHAKRFVGWNTIVLRAGEEHKIQSTIDDVIQMLIGMEADRSTTLVGVGGGVITDITGYVASVYMRGISFGFVPTTLLGLVDASIGGKNGIDVGVYKNMVGTIRQPAFLLHDHSFLKSLPEKEWQNGFSEIIKHACIKDARMFGELRKNNIKFYQDNKPALDALIKRNVLIKTEVVQKDEFESGDRKLLNFGHSLGHAIENQYELPHGHAVSIGMNYAAQVSEKLLGFDGASSVREVLEKYNLPVNGKFNWNKVIRVLQMDKKRVKKNINYVMLNRIGKGVVKPVGIKQLEKIITILAKNK